MFASYSSTYGLETPNKDQTSDDFTKSRFHQLMISKGKSQEEIELMKSLFAGYNCDLHLANNTVQPIQLRLTVDLNKDTAEDSKFESYNISVIRNDGEIISVTPLRHISDVYMGNHKFPAQQRQLTTTANCFSLISKSHPSIDVSMAFIENKKRWLEGLKLWFNVVSKPTKNTSVSAQSLTQVIPPKTRLFHLKRLK